jgi:UDP:flavonoid glycosyltransferase YjiC (YdhE family)
MRVAVVAGPDPGHAFPAAALALRLRAAGHEPTIYTGHRWLSRLGADGLRAVDLPGARAGADDPDIDWGYRLHGRAAAAAPALAELLREDRAELVVADTLTASGGLAAELVGLPWVELLPHPLQTVSVALPPPGTGLAPGRTPVGRARDAVLRWLHARSVEQGRRQRAAARVSIGLAATDPGPAYRLVATLPVLEPYRPDWPARTEVIGPLHWEPAESELRPPSGSGPLVFVSPPTAASGRTGVMGAVLAAAGYLRSAPLPAMDGLRVAATVLAPEPGLAPPPWASVGLGRQAPLLAAASVVVAGGGHGMVSKALAAGVPLVLLPGGGDQRDLSRRVARLGAGITIEREATPRRLAAAIARVLTDPGYPAAANAAAGSAPCVVDPVRLCAQAVTDRAEGPW